MTEEEYKRLFKVNSISKALNIALILFGILVSSGSIFMIAEEKEPVGVLIHVINHMVMYGLIVFNTCYGYRIKKINLIRIISVIFAILTTTASIIFLVYSDLAIPMSIFSMLASVALIYFALRCDHHIEAHIALTVALLFFLIYSITGCVRLDVANSDYRGFYGLSLFGSFIVTCAIFHSYFITLKPRYHVMNPPKESEIERILD